MKTIDRIAKKYGDLGLDILEAIKQYREVVNDDPYEVAVFLDRLAKTARNVESDLIAEIEVRRG